MYSNGHSNMNGNGGYNNGGYNNNGYNNGGYNNGGYNNNGSAIDLQKKLSHRRTIDPGSQLGKYVLQRGIYKNKRVVKGSMRPEAGYLVDLLSPQLYKSEPVINEHTKFVHLSANKAKHQIHAMKWTPYGRRLLVASHNGEFTLWNGTTFNFESIMQAHDSLIYSLQYSHNDDWLISGDQDGTIKYWQPNFNNVNILSNVHTGCITELCFSPNDSKFVSSSDDHMLKIWNFNNGKQELTLSGHHWDVKSCDWHPTLGLIVSGSKDNMMNFWDPRVSSGGKPITTIRGFKHTVQKTKFQPIGTQRLLAATAKDKSARIFDIRQMKDVLVLRNQQCDFATLTWHPVNSQLLTVSDFNGKIDSFILDRNFPEDNTKELGYSEFSIPYAHEKLINQIEYNPLGNILATASSDKTIRFWARSRPLDPQLFKDATYTNDKNGVWYYNNTNNDSTDNNLRIPLSSNGPTAPPPMPLPSALPGMDSGSLPGF